MAIEIDELAGRLEIGDVVGTCPLQCEGTVDGLPFYFRARGEHWQFCVAATPAGDPLDVWLAARRGEDLGGGFYRSGAWDPSFPGTEWLLHAHARDTIRRCAAAFLCRRR